MASIKEQAVSGVLWNVIQSTSTRVVGFVISIVLARLLAPEDYGLVAMVVVFTSIATSFVKSGFTASLIQTKDLSSEHSDTAFTSGVMTGVFLYIIFWCIAPLIARFYEEPALVSVFRVESLMIVFAALGSVPQAILARKMQFKKTFVGGLVGTVAQGVVGVILACCGCGVWALVYSTLTYELIFAVTIYAVSGWRPKLYFSWTEFKKMYAFNIRIVLSSFLNTVFDNIRSLIIGKRYSGADLAYYNRGYQFPMLIMTQVDGAVSAVSFPAFAKFQDNWDAGLKALRRTIRLSMYICMPLLTGLFVVAEPMIRVLLTEKWMDSVPYLRIMCFLCITWVLSAQNHALNALGKSRVTLWLNVLGKALLLISILLSYRISVSAMVMATVAATYLFCFCRLFVFQKYLHYKITDKVKDLFPTVLLSGIMGGIVYTVTWFGFSDIVTLVIQILLGIAVYAGLSVLTRNESFFYLKEMAAEYLKRLGVHAGGAAK